MGAYLSHILMYICSTLSEGPHIPASYVIYMKLPAITAFTAVQAVQHNTLNKDKVYVFGGQSQNIGGHNFLNSAPVHTRIRLAGKADIPLKYKINYV